MRFIAFVSKMVSYIIEARYFLKIFAFLIWEIKEKVSLQEESLGTKGRSGSQRKRAKL